VTRPARPSPAEQLAVAFWRFGEMRGHTWRDPILYADAMSELGDAEAGVTPGAVPPGFILAEVEPTGWRRLFRRRS
jgi:hypothetical protein